MRHTVDVANNGDIEKLLAEIAGTQGAKVPAPQPSAQAKSGGRFPFAVIAAVVMGGAGWVSGLLLPGLASWSAGVGAAFAGFLTALIAGPPRWFSS